MPAQFISDTGPPLVDLDIPDTGLFSGIPAAVSYANLLSTALSEVLEYCMNEALEEHVEEYRGTMDKDEDYRPLARYYDVEQDEEDVGDLMFDFYGLPSHLRAKATALEYGAPPEPARALMRRTLFKDAREVLKGVGKDIDIALYNTVNTDA